MRKTLVPALLLLLTAGPLYPRAQEDVVGFWRLQLQPGWSLVSLPVLPADPTPENVFGDRLGTVEITTWDQALSGYRYARHTPGSGWSGDLYLLDRGVAYWVNLGGEQPAEVVLTGHPEVYSKFRWYQLGTGWRFYAPTYGSVQSTADLPPDHSSRYLLDWNTQARRFELNSAGRRSWRGDLQRFDPDRAYLAYQELRSLRRTGGGGGGQPLTVNRSLRAAERDPAYEHPPWPLVVGNSGSLPVCYPGGDACQGSFTVQVVRETVQPGPGGLPEPTAEVMDEQRVPFGEDDPGRFVLALTVSASEPFLNPGDRVYLVVLGPNRSRTRSVSFEVPQEEHFVPDVDFPDPLQIPGSGPVAPAQFALGRPHPNPFNDRFQFEFALPETAPVRYALYDLSGREVISAKHPFSAGTHRVTLKAGALPTGLYILEVSAAGKSGIAKVAHLR